MKRIQISTLIFIITLLSCNTYNNENAIDKVGYYFKINKNKYYGVLRCLNIVNNISDREIYIFKIRDKQTVMLDTSYKKPCPWFYIKKPACSSRIYNFMNKQKVNNIIINNNYYLFELYGFRNNDYNNLKLIYTRNIYTEDFENYQLSNGTIPKNNTHWIYQIDSLWYILSP